MMRVFWDEWRGGRAASTRTFLPALVCVTVVALAFARFQPGVFFELLAAGLVVGGAWSGSQRWNEVTSWDWAAEGVAPVAYAAGKLTGFAFVAGFWVVVLAPAWLLLTLVWGLQTGPLASCMGWALAGGLTAQALANLAAWGPSVFSRFAGGTLIFGWLTFTILSPSSRGLNPFWQISRLQSGGDADPAAMGLLASGVVMVWLAIVVARRSRKAP